MLYRLPAWRQPQRRRWVPSAAATGITGTLSASIGTITLSSGATLSLSGTLTGSVGTIGLSAQGALSLTGLLSQSIGTITLSAQGASGTTGTLAQTLGAVTLSAQGAIAITGAVSQSIGTIGLSSAADLDIVGTLGQTLDPITLSATGELAGVGTGQLSQSIGTIGLSATGALALAGQLAQTMAPITLAGAGTLTLSGALSRSIGQIILTARGGAPIEEPTKVGGDDVPRDRGHRGWDQKRSTIKRSEELRLEQSIRSIYRELTESPEMAPRAAAALARLAAPGTSEDELPRIAARRALAMDSVGVEVETSLRMLREELSELEQFHEATMIAALLERLL